MRKRLHTRVYTNFILTVIAVLLLLLSLHAYQVTVSSSAQAQTTMAPTPLPAMFRVGEHSTDQRVPPAAGVSVPQTQDLAQANAISEVAAANREIAAAIRELAQSVDNVGGVLRANSGSAAVVAPEAAPAPVAPAAAPTARTGGVEVQISPAGR